MKIIHIIDHLAMGGAENLLIGLAGEQIKRGNEVTVSPLVCPDHTPVRDKIEANGIKVSPLRDHGSVYNPFFIYKIAKIIGEYEVVHVHLFPALYWAGLAKLFCHRVPLVYTEHNTNNRRRGNAFLHISDCLIYQYCYKMIAACSIRAKETFCESFPSIKHICAINNGVDTEINREAEPYSKRELLGIEENCFVVTMVSRFMPQKRQDTIVKAIAKLPFSYHAVFVGGEPSDEGVIRIKELASKECVMDRIHFLYIRSDVPRILKTSDVIIMSSDFEGLSLSSVEGMAAGKPFIATNVNGLKEVVGDAGILFENGDSESLAQILIKLKTNEGYYNKIAAKCSDRANDFDVKMMVDSYMNLYNDVIKGNIK